MRWRLAAIALGCATLMIGSSAHAAVAYIGFSGCCDASGAAPVNDVLFAAASDEENTLRLYDRMAGGAPVGRVPLAAVLGGKKGDEADFEGAARLGDMIFWIGSHSRPKDGKLERSRRVLLATRIVGDGSGATLKPEGGVYRGLVEALASAPSLATLNLGAAAERPGEDPGGLNIEGLAATMDGGLLLGFRNPVPGGMALVIPLRNPMDVIRGKAADLGPAQQVPLGGMGIRDLAWTGREYLIISGPAEGGGRHRLFRWLPGGAPEEIHGAWPKGFQAEGLVVGPLGSEVLALGDEGGEKIGGDRCEDMKDRTRRVFRGVRVAY